MRICVLGGGGFIGRSTVRWARKYGHEVWSFDRSHGQDILGPLDGLSRANVCINLAGVLGTAELFERPEVAVEVNVIGALRVLQWCEEHEAGYVGITMPESGWANVYTATKHCAGDLANAWHRHRGVPVSMVRAFNAYGPGQANGPTHPRKIVPTFSTQAWAGKPIEIWGDGEQTVDLVHADDVGRMLVEAAEHGDESVFDAGTGTALTVTEVADRIAAITGSKAPHRYLDMRDGEDPQTHIVAAGDGWERLTWKPEHSWDRIAEAVRGYRP